MKNFALFLFTTLLATLLLALPAHRADGRAPRAPTAGQFRFRQDVFSVVGSAGAVDVVIERIDSSDRDIVLGADTFDGTATAGQDYPATAETVEFADGETEKTVSIPILDNGTAEPDETFLVTVNLMAGCGTIVEPSSTTITIMDDDTTPPGNLHVSSERYAGLENSGAITITVRAPNNSGNTSRSAISRTRYVSRRPRGGGKVTHSGSVQP